MDNKPYEMRFFQSDNNGNADSSQYCNGDVIVLQRAYMKQVFLFVNSDIFTAGVQFETDQ